MEMTVPSGTVVFGPITTLKRDGSKVSKTAGWQQPCSSDMEHQAYVIGQDTLFVEPHACFHLNVVTDNRLIDQHVPFNMNIIPDVGIFQLYIITC